MIGVPVNPNSVYVSMIQTECSNSEFDSTYPIHLNGIISQDEFRESINRINHAFLSFKTYIIICWIIFALTVGGGVIFSVVAGVIPSVNHSITSEFYILLGVGIALTTFGSIFFSVGYCMIYAKRITRMRQAVANESMKYSSKSPIPCSWRLDSSRTSVGAYAHYNNHALGHNLVIDIGRSSTPESGTYYSNQIAPESTLPFERQDKYEPPPYSGLSTGFCFQCSAPRQDRRTKFCSSCGHSFNKNKYLLFYT